MTIASGCYAATPRYSLARTDFGAQQYREAMSEPDASAGTIRRAVLLLSAFGPEGIPLRFADIVQRTGLPKSTTHRLLAELTRLRLIERASDLSYRLGGRLFELGMLASLERSLIEVAMPFLQDLYERSHETVHLGIREGNEVVYISKIGGHRQARTPSRIGGRMPLHCTAIGKVLLAHCEPEFIDQVLAGPLPRRTPRTVAVPNLLRSQLARALDDGVAYEWEESTVGVVCIATPIFDTDDQIIAAVSIAGQAARFKPDQFKPALRAAAAGVSATLARRATPHGNY